MKMDLETLARTVEERVPTAQTTCVYLANQIMVTFMNRSNIEVTLLTPWFQRQIRTAMIDSSDVTDLVSSLLSIQSASF